MEKLRSLFQRPDLPDETRQIYLNARSPRELIKGLEALRGRNEADLRDSEQELIALEKAVAVEENSVRRGGLTRTEETIALRRIDRLEKQRSNLDKQVSIYNANVNLHLNLIAKIQEVDAMRSRGVGEEEIDRLVDEVQDNVQQYKRVSIAAENGSAVASAVDESAERRRLDEIKKRVLGTSAQTVSQTQSEGETPRPKTLE
jgi:hypothetical protein